MEEQMADIPELYCPLCGYNIAVQILMRSERCSECGFILPAFDPEPRDTLEQRWEEMAEAVHKRIRKGLSDGYPFTGFGTGKPDGLRADHQ